MRRCLFRLRAPLTASPTLFLAASLIAAHGALAAGPPPRSTASVDSRPAPAPFRDPDGDGDNAVPLGGPSVQLKAPENPRTTTGGSAARPAGNGDNRTTPAQPSPPRVVYNDASENPSGDGKLGDGNQPPSALGPAPYDLALIKRMRVVSTSLAEAPLRVGNLDVLAPLVDELPLLGATVTRAEPKNIPGGANTPTESQFFQINLPHGDPIVLTTGKSSAWVGSNEQTLRAAPLIIQNQIWLPVFSIAPLLGAAARLDDNGTLILTPTVQSVELFEVKGALAVTVKTSAPLGPNSAQLNVLHNPERIYVDFPGYSMGFDANNSTIERVVAPGIGSVTKARAGMPSKFPDVTRITLDLKKPLASFPSEMPDKSLYALVLASGGGSRPVMASNVPDIPEAPVAQPVNLDPDDPNGLRGMTIVVDAGHGGHDTGAQGAKSNEKDHNLDIARRLRNHLEARGATVLMTRDTDNFISLQGRVDFANYRHVNMFVSVHINASVNTGTGGTETYYYTAQSQSLAREVHKELIRATGRLNRGIRQARFFVIRKTWMPSILTETAFITNANEENLLRDPAFREKVARGIAQGVSNYVSVYGRPGLSG